MLESTRVQRKEFGGGAGLALYQNTIYQNVPWYEERGWVGVGRGKRSRRRRRIGVESVKYKKAAAEEDEEYHRHVTQVVRGARGKGGGVGFRAVQHVDHDGPRVGSCLDW
ncbi:hypothetical protein GW17_00023789 [Ensete ventricosum]|nr:hypothetical protein GW17_00023789 [Ensete ventricosum]RZR98253.1 hypothetical protein BHM03_00027562 [Ensete ventricosum]